MYITFWRVLKRNHLIIIRNNGSGFGLYVDSVHDNVCAQKNSLADDKGLRSYLPTKTITYVTLDGNNLKNKRTTFIVEDDTINHRFHFCTNHIKVYQYHIYIYYVYN